MLTGVENAGIRCPSWEEVDLENRYMGDTSETYENAVERSHMRLYLLR